MLMYACQYEVVRHLCQHLLGYLLVRWCAGLLAPACHTS